MTTSEEISSNINNIHRTARNRIRKPIREPREYNNAGSSSSSGSAMLGPGPGNGRVSSDNGHIQVKHGSNRKINTLSSSSSGITNNNTSNSARRSIVALVICSLVYVAWIVCCALLLEQESGPLTHIHSIGHLMKKQKSYLRKHLQKFAQAHNKHHLRSNALAGSSNNGNVHHQTQNKNGHSWTFNREEQIEIQQWHKNKGTNERSSPVLTAFVEDSTKIPRTADTVTYPLPLRTQSPNDLKVFQYPQVENCSQLPGHFPVNHPLWLNEKYPNVQNNDVWTEDERIEYAKYNPIDADPYLPWIHDVFPSIPVMDESNRNVLKSTHIEFVAQNKRRCNTALPFH